MVFLESAKVPTVAVLYEDNRGGRHVKTYEVLMKEQTLIDGPWHQSNVENGAEILIPVRAPYGGVVIVGLQTIAYHSGTEYIAINIGFSHIYAWGNVDGPGSNMFRYLLSDSMGNLGLLVLEHNEIAVTGIKVSRSVVSIT